MVYSPRYYPGSSTVGINRRKHVSGCLEKIRDLPDTDIARLCELTVRMGDPIAYRSKAEIRAEKAQRKAEAAQRFQKIGKWV